MSRVRLPFSKEYTIDKGLLLYGLALIYAISEVYLANHFYNQYVYLQGLEEAGIKPTTLQDDALIAEGFFLIIGPPVFLKKALEAAESNRMGDRLEKNCPNF